MILGVTGTRWEPSILQLHWLADFFRTNPPTELHHGACTGADTCAHHLAVNTRQPIKIVVHPPVDEKHMTPTVVLLDNTADVTILRPKTYHLRNHDIVHACDQLVALPEAQENHPQSGRSGTWSTVRFAVGAKKPVTICHRDGRTEER